MSKPFVKITLRLDRDISDPEIGRAFMQALCDHDDRLIPQKVDIADPIRKPFPGVDEFAEKWWAMLAKVAGTKNPYSAPYEYYWGPSLKRNKALKYWLEVNHSTITKKGDLSAARISFSCHWHKDVDFEKLFNRWLEILQPNRATLHLFASTDLTMYDEGVKYWSSFSGGSFGGRMRPGIANISWAMLYGDELPQGADINMIESEGFRIESSKGGPVIKTTEDLNDVMHNYEYFSQRRAKMKSLFHPDVFDIKDEPI